jgi:hypothetical protein
MTGDLPRDEAMRLAEEAILGHGGPERAAVQFKFTCANCGKRCTFCDANTLHTYGECCDCGHETKVDKAGFLLMLLAGPIKPNAEAN